jgi:hypothetical protein
VSGWKEPAMFTDQKIDFPRFREGWGIPPQCRKSHYMIRKDLTNTVWSICGSIERMIDHHGNGYWALWAEGTFERCGNCKRMRRRRR